MIKALRTVGRYFMLMGRTFSRPERMRMFFRQYLNELEQLGVNSIGIVLLISFFIGAVITIQIKLNIESPWMPRWTVGYVTREIMLLEFSGLKALKFLLNSSFIVYSSSNLIYNIFIKLLIV
jgi:phospholipid/cholesterol/gamma-HCH transport system permease protein